MIRVSKLTTIVAAVAVAGLVAACGASTENPRTASESQTDVSTEQSADTGETGQSTGETATGASEETTAGGTESTGSAGESTGETSAPAGEPEPLNLNLPADPTIEAMVPSTLADSGVIRFTTDASYPPNEFIKEGTTEPRGMSIDLGNAIGQLMGLKTQWTNADFDGILAGLEAGRADMSISSFTDTKKREKVVNFVTYLEAGTSIVVQAGNPAGINGAEDLCGREVGAENGTTQYDMLTLGDVDDSVVQICQKAGKDAPIAKGFPNQNDVNAALDAGRIDAYMADTPVAVWAVETTGGRFAKVGADVGVAPYGVAVPKKPEELTKAVQAAIQKLIDDGSYQKILDNWGLGDEAIPTSEINAAVF